MPQIFNKIINDLNDERTALEQIVEFLSVFGRVEKKIDDLSEQLQIFRKEVKMDISKLSEAISTLSTDFSTFKSDFTTFLGTVTVSDPAQQTAVDNLTASVTTLDDGLKTLDTTVKGGVTGPSGTTGPATV
jgi:hypothetical protein